MAEFVIALDQGTTSCRALLVDQNGTIVQVAQKEFTQIFPQPGWVEHDPMEIWDTQMEMLQQVLQQAEVDIQSIKAIGITNQRETAVVWNRETGEPIYNAIVWQDKRTANICEDLKSKGLESYVRKETGLVLDSYFSGTKIKWILDQVEGAKELAENGKLAFGTVDTWLIWKMTGGEAHVTDYTNASRTLIYNIRSQQWDQKMLGELDIPSNMLPAVQPSASLFGEYRFSGHPIPICGVAGDQQAALFGQACFKPGMAKNTYGTGCFMLMHTGSDLSLSDNGLLTTLACNLDQQVQYALEGSIFIAGAAIQWLRDGIQIINDAAQSEELARSVSESHDVYVVPAFAGLGAPYWDMYARGAIFGLTRDTSRAHLVKATLESLAYQTKDVLVSMEQDSGLALSSLKVDGGAVANNYLMEFQADILGVPVERPEIIETTALGAAYLAGIQIGMWSPDDVTANRGVDRVFAPEMESEQREKLYQGWQKAINRSADWLDH